MHNPARNVQIEESKKHQYFRVSRQASGRRVASTRILRVASAATNVLLRAGEDGLAPPVASSDVIQTSAWTSRVPVAWLTKVAIVGSTSELVPASILSLLIIFSDLYRMFTEIILSPNFSVYLYWIYERSSL